MALTLMTSAGIFAPGAQTLAAVSTNTPIALWLELAPKQNALVLEIITELAQEHSTPGRLVPIFPPHATLCTISNLATFPGGWPDLIRRVDQFCATGQEFSAEVTAVRPLDHRDESFYGDTKSNSWSTFEFISLEPKGQIQALFQMVPSSFPGFGMRKDPRDATQTQIMPHVSLMYCDPTVSPKVDRERLESTQAGISPLLPRIPARIQFVGIQVVIPHSQDWNTLMKDARETWDVVYSRRFGESDTAGKPPK